MNTAARSLSLALLLLYGAGAAPALACAILPPDQVAQKRKEQLEEMKVEARALHDAADLVFVGYLYKLDSHEESVDRVGTFPEIRLVHRAYFRAPTLIKGRYADTQALEFTTSKTRVVISCKRDFQGENPGEHGAGETYLVYARDGKILRTNRLPYYHGLMDGQQEADFLRGARRD